GAASAPARHVALERAAPEPPATLRDVRILLVADDPSIIQVVGEAFAHAGAHVRGRESVDVPLHPLAGWQPDGVVSDIDMPARRARGARVAGAGRRALRSRGGARGHSA